MDEAPNAAIRSRRQFAKTLEGRTIPDQLRSESFRASLGSKKQVDIASLQNQSSKSRSVISLDVKALKKGLT